MASKMAPSPANVPFPYDQVAPVYARYREMSGHVLDELQQHTGLDAVARVLEVGSGTGNHVAALAEATGCRAVGIEPSRRMVGRASGTADVAYVQGVAESLPFARGAFTLLFSVNVIHHLADTAAYFRAARRVLQPGGWLCTATDSAAIIRRRQPLAHYWPETVAVDLPRYPPIERLLAQLAVAGFEESAVHEIARPFAVTDSAPFRERAYSCLHLIPDAAFHDGLRRLEQDLEQGAVVGQSEFACIWGRAARTGR